MSPVTRLCNPKTLHRLLKQNTLCTLRDDVKGKNTKDAFIAHSRDSTRAGERAR